jgi:hypothetical protein
MQTANFQDLVRATCLELNVADTNASVESGAFEVDNALVTLRFDEDTDDDLLSVYVQVPGTEDLTENPDVLRAMLMLNASTGSKTKGTFAMDPYTGLPMFATQFTDLDEFDGVSLAEIVRLLVAQGAGGINAVRSQIA